MIGVTRRASLRPPHLTSAAAVKEIADAAAFYARRENQGKPFRGYRAYRHATVRERLREVFDAKCAYCESRFEGTSDTDVEHWRPKGSIRQLDGTTVKPGYYWLAADWSNLLLSCTLCNRIRTYRIPSVAGRTASSTTLGKGDLFPLADPDLVARCAQEIGRERPLLLDPCAQKVETYFEFVLDGDQDAVGLIRPRAKSGQRRVRAEVTIDVFALNRPSLVEDRRRSTIQLARALEGLVLDLAQLGAVEAVGAEASVVARARRRVELTVDALADLIDPHTPFQLMKRQQLATFRIDHPDEARALLAAFR